MFNKNMIDVLTQINGIADSIILKYPRTIAVSEQRDIIVSCDVSKLDGEEFSDIGIMNLADFLNIFKLFPDGSDCSMLGNTINISSDNTSSTFIVDNTSLMDAYEQSPEQFTKTEEAPSVATFDLTQDDIKKLKSASGVFKTLDELMIASQDGDIKLSLAATGSYNARSNTFDIMKQASTTKEFEIKIPVENFKKLPVSDYEVQVKYNSSMDHYRLLILNKSLEGFKILMSIIA